MKGRRRSGLPIPSLAQFVGGMFVFGLCGGVAFADSNDLRLRLERLAADSDFVIGGLEWIGDEAVGEAQGSVLDQVNFLLQNYNHLLIQDDHGAIKKVLVTSRKTSEDKRWTDTVTVYTRRVGRHHQVEATIAGPNASSVQTRGE